MATKDSKPATAESIAHKVRTLKGHCSRHENRIETLSGEFTAPGGKSSQKLEEISAAIKIFYSSIQKYEEAVNDLSAVAPDAASKESPRLSSLEDIYIRYEGALKVHFQELQDERSTAQAPAGAGAPDPSPVSTVPKQVVKAPPIVAGDVNIKQFSDWEDLWGNYASLTELEKKPQKVQLATFWAQLSVDFIHLVRHVIGIEKDTALPLHGVIDRIKTHLRSKRNNNVDWQTLLKFKQDGASIDTYYAKLQEQMGYVGPVTRDRLMTAILILG